MAASSSTMFLNTSSTLGGKKSWVRQIAMATPKNPPSSRASAELYSVPQISGSTPNCPLLTSHVVEVMKCSPYFCMAGAALPPTRHKRYTINTIVSQAKANVRPRNDRSRNVSSVDGGREIDVCAADSEANIVDFIGCCPGWSHYWMLFAALATISTTWLGRGM